MERIRQEKAGKAKRRKKNVKAVIRQLKRVSGIKEKEDEMKRERKRERKETLDELIRGIQKLCEQEEEEEEDDTSVKKKMKATIAYVNSLIQDKRQVIRLSRDDDALIITLQITRRDGTIRELRALMDTGATVNILDSEVEKELQEELLPFKIKAKLTVAVANAETTELTEAVRNVPTTEKISGKKIRVGTLRTCHATA